MENKYEAKILKRKYITREKIKKEDNKYGKQSRKF